MGLRYEIPRVPNVYHYVMGRKVFGKEPVTIKAMWKVGRYNARGRLFRREHGRKVVRPVRGSL